MRLLLHKTKKQILTIFKYFGLILIISSFSVSTIKYTKHANLYNNVEFKILGQKFINEQKILSLLNHLNNISILNINLNEVKNEVLSLEFIESVQLSLILPNTLVINIIEKTPIALINCNDQSIFIDKNGIVLKSDYRSIAFYPVPLITYKNCNTELFNSKFISKEDTDLILHIFNKYIYFYNDLSEVLIDSENIIFLNDTKTKIYTNKSNLRKQLYVLNQFKSTIYPAKSINDYIYIDLRTNNQVIVKENYKIL
tara:strand:- start:1271 stop:2035 length:765 start_codon:yes stop_codon:yes gene_type:complete